EKVVIDGRTYTALTAAQQERAFQLYEQRKEARWAAFVAEEEAKWELQRQREIKEAWLQVQIEGNVLRAMQTDVHPLVALALKPLSLFVPGVGLWMDEAGYGLSEEEYRERVEELARRDVYDA